MEAKLTNPETYRDGTDIARLTKEFSQLKQQVEEFYESWEIHRLRLEKILKLLKKG